MTELDAPPPPAVDAAALGARFAARAAADGLAEVAFATLDTPVGRVVAAATRRGLARLAYEDANGGVEAVLAHLAGRLSPRIVEAPARLEGARRQLVEYFAGRRERFELDVDLALAAPFARRILAATARVPFGQTRTYGEIAAAAGSPAASRAAGNALGANPVPIVVPCHRVLRAGGGLGGYTGGLERKERLLSLEGYGRG